MKKSKQEEDDENGKVHAALIVIIKEGNDNGVAYGKLFLLCDKGFVRYADSYYHDIQESEITVGKAWDRFLDRLIEDRYIEMNKFEGLMHTIIRSIFNTKPTGFKKQEIIFIPMDVAMIDPKNSSHFADIPDADDERRKEEWEFIEAELDVLSEKDQKLVTMFYFEGKSYKEMADILKMKESSIRKALSRIRLYIISRKR
jgi:RNA polymerase sigma factor (sigma-70 family)